MGLTPVNSTWAIIRQHLEKELLRVRDEIRNYPAPIPACDAQFNYLLAERDVLSSELARARELMDRHVESGDARSSIDAFVSSSTHFGDSVKREIRALFENEHWLGEDE